MDKAFTVGRLKRRTTAGLMATPVLLLRMSPLLNYQLRPHNPVMETEFAICIRSNCDIAFAAPHAIRYGRLAAYFAFIALVASQSASGGDVRYWPHRSSIMRAGWSDARASKTCWKKLVASIKLRVR